MSIRKAETPDARGIAKVQVAAWKSAYRGLIPDSVLNNLSEEDIEKRWIERIARAWGHIFIAEREAHIVGFASCGSNRDQDTDPNKVGEIYTIYVHPAEWRHGYGKALAGEAMQSLRQDGFEEVILWVIKGNLQAIQFYEALGFDADGASKIKQRLDGTEIPVVRYRRREYSSLA
jgi:ribosomal protein S18 acetylase RimI-like enzyme